MAVAIGEQRRKREAMDLLVQDLAKGDDDNVSVAIRTALEVRDFYLCFFVLFVQYLSSKFLFLSFKREVTRRPS